MYYRYYSAVILFYIRFFFFCKVYRRYCYRFVVRLIIVLSYYCRRLETGVCVQLEYNVFFTARRRRQWAHVLRLNNIIFKKKPTLYTSQLPRRLRCTYFTSAIFLGFYTDLDKHDFHHLIKRKANSAFPINIVFF